RAYGEVGSGVEQGPEGAGVHQLYLDADLTSSRSFSVRAGLVPMPFGRWNAVTLTRPLIKAEEFDIGGSQSFLMRRSSAGISFHAQTRHFESAVAVRAQAPAEQLRIERDDGVDAVTRVGFRSGGLTAGVSLLEGRRGGDTVAYASGPASVGVAARGVDLQLS